MTRHTREGAVWVDLESPTQAEVEALGVEFKLSPSIVEGLSSPSRYPLVVTAPEYQYLILHFPTGYATDGVSTHEIDFVLGAKFLVTVRYKPHESMDALHRVLETEELLGAKGAKEEAAILFERVPRALYAGVKEEIARNAILLEHIEQDIFAGKEREVVRKISEIGRIFLRFETVLARNTDPLLVFLDGVIASKVFGKPFTAYANGIRAEHHHVMSIVHSHRAVVGELRTTNDSLLSVSQSEATKVFTAMAFFTFPLTLLIAIFSMDTYEQKPIIGNPHDFWIIIMLMIVLSLGFFFYFKSKRLL